MESLCFQSMHAFNKFFHVPVDITGKFFSERRKKLSEVWLFGKQGLLIFIVQNSLGAG